MSEFVARLSAPKRAEVLRQVVDSAIRKRDSSARVLTAENGKTLRESLGEVDATVKEMDWQIAEGRGLYGTAGPSKHAHQKTIRGLGANKPVKHIGLTGAQAAAPLDSEAGNTSALHGWLTSLRSRSVESALATMNLSVDRRPMRVPALTTKAPLTATMPTLRANQRALSSGADRLQSMVPTMPRVSICVCVDARIHRPSSR
jgi:hypothetical protein